MEKLKIPPEFVWSSSAANCNKFDVHSKFNGYSKFNVESPVSKITEGLEMGLRQE